MCSQRSLWYFLFCLGLLMKTSSAGTVFLNGPQLQASDLRQIDSYVSSALPIYPKGFQLYSQPGSRPIIVKMADPEGTKQQPNPGYYTNLPAVIPQGFEGIATSSFFLGSPLVFNQRTSSNIPAQQGNLNQVVAQPSIRVENSVEISEGNNNNRNVMQFMMTNNQGGQLQQILPQAQARSNFVGVDEPQKLITNPVVVETSRFENSLPTELRNPFYSNEYTAASLAQESLPVPGEEVIENWNTRKIQDGKIRDLLTGAGLI